MKTCWVSRERRSVHDADEALFDLEAAEPVVGGRLLARAEQSHRRALATQLGDESLPRAQGCIVIRSRESPVARDDQHQRGLDLFG
jgi:hypothetical protein